LVRTPENRLTFQEITTLLQDEQYWVPGTDPGDFRAYVEYLDREESKISMEGHSEWEKFLLQLGDANELSAELGGGEGSDACTRKVIQTLSFVCGTSENPNMEVAHVIRESLKHYRYIVPAQVKAALSK
jgi:hypothetical protein